MAGSVLNQLEAVQAFRKRAGDRSMTRLEFVPLGRLAGPPQRCILLESASDLFVFRRAGNSR
jgi:hypothetical protein